MQIVEFLFRGRTPSEQRPSEWHVQLGEDQTAFGETRPVYSGIMTPEQAAEKGFPLSAVLQGINEQVLAEHAAILAHYRRAQEEVAAANRALEISQQEAAALKEDLAKVRAELQTAQETLIRAMQPQADAAA